MKKNTIILLLMSLLQNITTAQTNCLNIGVNIGNSKYANAGENPFIDQCKYMSAFISSDVGLPGWNSNKMNLFTRDTNGYVTNGIPLTVGGFTTVVKTIISSGNRLKPGIYVLLYDGTGDFSLGGGGWTITNSIPGKKTINVTGTSNLQWLTITSSAIAPNHVRNIRLVPQAQEFTHTSDVFRQSFLDKLSPFYAIRFLDAFRTNGHPNGNWNTRTKVNSYTQADSTGLAYEWGIMMCNKTQKHAWVNVPHLADSTYIDNMARLFYQTLNQNLSVYVEYSNEVWNGGFLQHHWLVNSNGPFIPSNWGPNPLYDPNYGPSKNAAIHFNRVFRIWKRVFSADSTRLHRVLSTQLTNMGHTNALLSIVGSNFDYLAPTWYFGVRKQLDLFTASTTPQQVIDTCRKNFFERNFPLIKQAESAAANLGKTLVFYEGGQGIDADGDAQHPALQAFYAAQKSNSMYMLYDEVLDSLRTRNYPLAMAFAFAGGNSPFGSWGHIPDVDSAATLSSSPKYLALIDNLPANIPGCSLLASNPERKVTDSDFRFYPNPANNSITTINTQANTKIKLIDIRGKLVLERELQSDNQTINISNVSDGFYFIQLLNKNGSSTVKKLIIER